MMRANQCLGFRKRLPRNSRDFSALHGGELLSQIHEIWIPQKGHKIDMSVPNAIETREGFF
jgi:hypothetical protein